jgi:hypothetical protein
MVSVVMQLNESASLPILEDDSVHVLLLCFKNELDAFVMRDILLATTDDIVFFLLIISHKMRLKIKVIIKSPNVSFWLDHYFVWILILSDEGHKLLVDFAVSLVLIQRQIAHAFSRV